MPEALSESALYGKNKLKEFQGIFEPFFEELTTNHLKQIKETYNSEIITKVTDLIFELSKREAKRLRASFVYYVYKMFGGQKETDALLLGSVIELIHAYILIEDDFMDQSETRRHKPTAHKEFENYYEDKNLGIGKKEHFGISMSMLSAMLGSHFGQGLLSKLKCSPDTIIRINSLFQDSFEKTIFGQSLDVLNSYNYNVSEADVLKMLELKTGVYTYKNPIHGGAMLAGISDIKTLNILESFAISAGTAFQIQDDVLGMFGMSDITGKSDMDDLLEGKYTMLVHYVFDKGTNTQKAELKKYLGNRDITEKEHRIVKEIMHESGSLDYSKKLAKDFVAKAQKHLTSNRDLFKEEELKYLIGISDYTVERDK